jgi:hypothetical protein
VFSRLLFLPLPQLRSVFKHPAAFIPLGLETIFHNRMKAQVKCPLRAAHKVADTLAVIQNWAHMADTALHTTGAVFPC